MREPTITCKTPVSIFWHESEDSQRIIFECIDHNGAKRTMFDVFIVPNVLNENTVFVVKDYFTTPPIAYALFFDWIEKWVHGVYGIYPCKAPDNKSIFPKHA